MSSNLSAKMSLRSVGLLLLACVAVWGWTYGQWDIWGVAEGRNVQVAKEMRSAESELSSRLTLPLYWVLEAALSISEGEISPWALRAPFVLAAILTVLLTYAIARRAWSERAGLIAGFVTMTTPAFVAGAASARAPILVAFLLTFALWLAFALKLKSAPGPQLSGPRWLWIPLVVFQYTIAAGLPLLSPLAPAIALVVAYQLDRFYLDRAIRPWTARSASIAGIIFFFACAGVAVWIYKLPMWLWDRRIYALRPQAVVILVCGVIVLVFATWLWRRRTASSLLVAALALAFVAAVLRLGALYPALNPAKGSYLFARSVDALLRDETTRIVGAIGKASLPHFHVEGNYSVEPIEIASDALKKTSSLPDIIVAAKDDQAAIENSGGLTGYHAAGSVVADSQELIFYKRDEPPAGAKSGPLTFALVGDTGTGDGPAFRVGEQIAELHDQAPHAGPLEALIMLGDNLYGDHPFPVAMRERFIDPFEPVLDRHIPVYAVLGNHDDDVRDRWKGEMDSPLFGMEGRRYYKLKFGNRLVTFYMLNSETIQIEPSQVEWFREELAKDESLWKVVVIHRPLYASEIDHGPAPELIAILGDLLTAENGVDLVFAGHNHVYERRKPVKGVIHITSGNGGELHPENDWPDDPERVVGYNQSRGFAWLEIDGPYLKVHAITEDGETIDEFELTKGARSEGS